MIYRFLVSEEKLNYGNINQSKSDSFLTIDGKYWVYGYIYAKIIIGCWFDILVSTWQKFKGSRDMAFSHMYSAYNISVIIH